MVAVSRSGNVRFGVLKYSITVSMDGSSLTPSLERSRRKPSEACLKPNPSHTGDANTCRDILATSRVRNYTLSYLVRTGKRPTLCWDKGDMSEVVRFVGIVECLEIQQEILECGPLDLSFIRSG